MFDRVIPFLSKHKRPAAFFLLLVPLLYSIANLQTTIFDSIDWSLNARKNETLECLPILMVINFNSGGFEAQVVPRIIALYGKVFPIVFYSPTAVLVNDSQGNPVQVHYAPNSLLGDVEAPGVLEKNVNVPGGVAYISLVLAIKKYPNFQGYFLVSDDVALNYPILSTLNFSKPWGQGIGHYNDIANPKPYGGWYPWTSTWGLRACNKTWHSLNATYKDRLKALVPTPTSFIGTSAGGDIFYIPQRMAKDFVVLGEIFWEAGVFLEIAVPTIVYGILGDVETMPGAILWGTDRDLWGFFWNNKTVYVHPAKLSSERHYQTLQQLLANATIDVPLCSATGPL